MNIRRIDSLLCAGTIFTLTSLGGCSGLSSPSLGGAGIGSGSEFGATTGGIKDMNFARELVKNGRVPPAEAFLVEAMFAEHDLPLTGAPCATRLCLRGALGLAPTLSGEQSGWVQVGLSSTVDPATFARPPLSAIFTVDVSGSMGWDYKTQSGDYVRAAALADRLLRSIAERLGPEDHVTLVTYGSSASVVLDVTAGGSPQIIGAIDSLHTTGSTNMEAGLKLAYQVADRELGAGRQVRLFLFTDEQPNVGLTTPSEFQGLVQHGADRGVGITIFGLGLGLGQPLLDAMSHLRGGNAFSLTRTEQVATLFTESWPWMASPIAYDLQVALTPAVGYQLADTYGFPGAKGEAKLDVSTVFLSRKKGALLLRVRQSDTTAPASLQVSGALGYENLDGTRQSQTLDVSYHDEPLDSRGMYFAQPAVGSSVALAILVSGMHDAAASYSTSASQAVGQMEKVVERITADRVSLGDASLDVEVKLAADLLALMKSGASQESFYGQAQ